MTPGGHSGHGRSAPEGLILCGGESRRLGGLDKGLLRLGSTRGVEYSARLLERFCERLFISANRHIEDYAALGLGTVVQDQRRGFQGPLAGLEAVSGHLHSDRLLLLPCDVPDLCADVPAALLQRLEQDASLDFVYASSASGPHYLCAALRTRCLASITAQLDAQQRAVRHWCELQRHQTLEFSGDSSDGFRNYNHPSDWGIGSGAS